MYGSSVSGSVWSIGHFLVYAHSKLTFDKYGTALGINTMQGREAKHVQIIALPETAGTNNVGIRFLGMTTLASYGFLSSNPRF